MTKEAGSPHGYVNGRDLSGAVRSASGDPASSWPEESLIRAYRNGSDSTWPGVGAERRVESCVCGGDIESPDDWRAIRHAVEVHNDSTVHQQWRAWRDV